MATVPAGKTTATPGETITISFSGGSQSGWIRAILYRDNVEIARSTGPSSTGGRGGGAGFPITFTTTAPTPSGTSQTYTYAAAWFGNSNDSGSAHGEQRATTTIPITVSAPVAGSLSVSAGGLSSSGPAGGPFTPSSQAFTLSNPGGTSINWTATNAPSWVTVSPASGTLAAGAQPTPVTVSINSTAANGLAVGTYSGAVSFTNTTNGTGNTTRTVGLTVTAASVAGPLTVTPAGGLTSSCTVGSPYTPVSQAYTLRNTGTAPMAWTASKAQSWVTLSATSGTLAAGATATVTASTNSGVTGLTAGSYTDTVSFNNTTNDSGNTTRPVNLTVTAATLSSIAISGPSSVNESATATYAATATWSDGSTTTVTPAWSTSLGTISTSGVLSAPAVTADQTATVGASYSSGGVTRTASRNVTVVNVAATTGAIIPTPPDGAMDVPVNSVITARATGTTGIGTLFNKDTFTLKPTIATGDSSVGPNGPLAGSVCVSGGIVQGSFAYDTANTSATFTPNCELAHGETYAANVSTLPDPSAWQITTIPAGPDSDGDGVQDAQDDNPVNGKIASPDSPKGTGRFQIDATDTAMASLEESAGISEESARLNHTGRPAGYLFRDGLASFKVTGVVPGSTVTVRLSFPSGIPAGGKLYRVDASGFHEVPGVIVNGNTATLSLTDGGQGDSDGLVNGIIVDPVGMASPTTSGSGSIDLTTSGSSGGGCAVVARGGSGDPGIDIVWLLAGLALSVRGFRRRKRG